MLLRGAEGVFLMAKCILELNNVQISFGDRLLLDLDRLAVYDGERIGLIGENGAGKTTLLRVLSGELTPDAGQVRRLAPVAMIRQQGDADAGSDAEIRARFQAQETREGLSGGEMTRNRIAGALSARAGLLLADEPTTDLDPAPYSWSPMTGPCCGKSATGSGTWRTGRSPSSPADMTISWRNACGSGSAPPSSMTSTKRSRNA